MKAIILVAGIGERIAKNIGKTPKSLLPLYNKDKTETIPLIEYSIKMLQKYQVSDISIVTGYHYRDIINVVGQQVKHYHNPFYYLMNSLGSLWFALSEFDANDDMLIINGDTFLSHEIYEQICTKTHESPLLLIDSHRAEVADVRVRYSSDNKIIAYGKDIKESQAESLDVVKVAKEHVQIVAQQVALLLEQKDYNTWWESAIVYNDELPVHVMDIGNSFWSEIDYYDDYNRILNYLSSKAQIF